MKNTRILLLAAAAISLPLAGCQSVGPAEPTVAVMPGKGKSFERFQRDEAKCQAAAEQATGYRSPGEAANNSAVGGAVVGTAVGAIAGAAIGAATGNAGRGAAIGAGSGLVGGTIVGASNGNAAGGRIQARYDTVYAQCMSAKGHRIDGPDYEPAPVVYAPPPPVVYAPPPPVYVEPYYRPRPYWW